MGDSGTLTFSGTGGSSVLNAIDDVTPTAGEESWDDVTGADCNSWWNWWIRYVPLL